MTLQWFFPVLLLSVLSAFHAICGEAAPAPTPIPTPAPAAAHAGPERLPIPTDSKTNESVALLKDVLKGEYQKSTAADRSALAHRLIQVAKESKADPNLYYASLREARDVAVSAGDIEAAWTACETLAQSFVLDEREQKTAVLIALSRAPVTGEPALKIVKTGRELLEAYASESNFDAATKLIPPLEDLARRSNDPDTFKSLQAQAKEIRAQQSEWARIKPFVERLKDNPADADAALAVGKYHILSTGDWEKAVAVLTKCASPALQAAAEKDLAAPTEAEAKADVGDLWWTASEKETGALKTAYQQRALNWYQQAMDGLAPARKMKTEKRVQGALSSGNSVDSLKAAGLVFWVNPASDQSGAGRELLSGTAPKFVGAVPVVVEAGTKAFKLNDTYPTYAMSDPVKAVTKSGSAVVWFRMDKSVGTNNGLLFKGVAMSPKAGNGRTDLSIMTQGDRLIVFFNWPDNDWPGVEGKTAFFSKRPAPLGKWAMVATTWDGATISIYLNGEREMSYKSPLTPMRSVADSILGLGCDPAGVNQPFIGLMGGAMIFNRALTDAELRQIYLKSGIQGK